MTFKDDNFPSEDCFVPVEKLQKLVKKGVVGAVLYVCESTQEHEKSIKIPNTIAALLQIFKRVFEDPMELPPHRKCDHDIPLKSEDKVVNQMPPWKV